jgi:BMFP domain-containing protein YqiC
MELVRREELEAAQEMAANARAGQEAADTVIAALQVRLSELEARVAHLESPVPDAGASEGL